MNIKLEEATTKDLENAIYIPYEELKEWAEGKFQPEVEMLSRSGDGYYINKKTFYTTSKIDNPFLVTIVNGVKVNFKGTSFTFDFTFQAGNTSDWSVKAKVDYLYVLARAGEKVVNAYARYFQNEYNKYPYNFGFRFRLDIIAKTKIQGKEFIFRVGINTNVRVKLATKPTTTTLPMETLVKFEVAF